MRGPHPAPRVRRYRCGLRRAVVVVDARGRLERAAGCRVKGDQDFGAPLIARGRAALWRTSPLQHLAWNAGACSPSSAPLCRHWRYGRTTRALSRRVSTHIFEHAAEACPASRTRDIHKVILQRGIHRDGRRILSGCVYRCIMRSERPELSRPGCANTCVPA